MHASITANNDTYESGTTAVVQFKYTLDRGAIHAGDYVIVTIPAEIASTVEFSVNAQHFSGKEDLGNGRYKLTFAKDIESGLSGSFSAFVTTKADKTTSGTITAADASKTITVVPSSSSGSSGTYTDTIMKDVEASGVSYSGYDYSDGYGDHAAQIGVTDLTNGGTYKYRLFVNDKKGDLSNVTVVDRLPDGMTLSESKGFEVIDQDTGKAVDPSLYTINQKGQTLTFKYPGNLRRILQINYWVDIPADSNTSKYTNTATITYTADGDVHQEHRNYVLQGTSNNASNGEKSVDKSIITTDPDDQFVTYSIKFWNSNGFNAGKINLTDQLDPHVKFIGADPNEYFTVTQDSADPQKISIINTKPISSSLTTFVRFMVDMTGVPVGYTVKNTVGGNTTKTTKYDGGLTLTAKKLIDGKSDGLQAGQFSFQLLQNGHVLQTKSNDASGNIDFDRISYTKDDAGKTYTYTVAEQQGTDADYTYDSAVYTVTVTPHLERNSEGSPTGRILAEPTIMKGETEASAIVFNNTTKKKPTGSLVITKTTNGGITPADASFTITGPNNYSKTVKYSEFTDGKYTLSNLPVGEYTVTENADSAKVDGYSLNVTGNGSKAAVKNGETASATITNTYTPNQPNIPVTPTVQKTSVKVTKNWVGGEGTSAVVHLLADGKVADTVELNAQNGWTHTFANLDKQSAGHDILYAVMEDKVDGYSAAITGDAQNGYVITNTKNQPNTPSKPEHHNGDNTPSHPSNSGHHTTVVTKHQTVTPMTPKTAKTAVSENHTAVSASTPKTGDTTDLSLYAFLFGGAAALLAAVLALRSRKKN
ncbi:MAG: Cna B-type domain-containing protein [Eubacterium sp.]